jgi:hypothetical protein
LKIEKGPADLAFESFGIAETIEHVRKRVHPRAKGTANIVSCGQFFVSRQEQVPAMAALRNAK